MKLNAFISFALLALYIFCVVSRLETFPPFFFCDEAMPGVDAYDLLHTGKDWRGRPWPLFFEGLGDYALSLTVYLQIPFSLLFGKSIFAVRLCTALISALGVMGCVALVRREYNGTVPWVAYPLFALTPIWFLHARTGFEYVAASSFYLLFLFAYGQMLKGGNKWVVISALFASACFYSYTPARGWVLAALALVFLFNFRFHLQDWRRSLFGVILVSLILAPYFVHTWQHPELGLKRLRSVGFGAFKAKSFTEKATHILDGYRTVLNPTYWATEAGTVSDSVERHRLSGYTSIPNWIMLFVLLGALRTLLHIKDRLNRAIVAFLLAAPSTASLVSINHERTLGLVPVFLLLATLGVNWIFSWIRTTSKIQACVKMVVAMCLGAQMVLFYQYSVTKAPLSYTSYGFYGIQSGAKEVFEWISNNHNHTNHFYIAEGSFNAASVFSHFFLAPSLREKVSFAFIEEVCTKHGIMKERNGVWFVRTESLAKMISDGCPIEVLTRDEIRDPTGASLFRIVDIRAKPELEAWIKKHEEAEAQHRLEKQRATITNDGTTIEVIYPALAHGEIGMLFDRDLENPIRVDQINPALFRFLIPRESVKQITLTVANVSLADVTFRSRLGEVWISWGTQNYSSERGDKTSLVFDAPLPHLETEEIELSIGLPNHDASGSPHLSEISWK